MRHIVPLLIATAAFAAEGQPLVEVSMPDGARLRAHVDASIYGTLWADPAFEPVRSRVESGLADLKTEKGLDLARWYAALVSAGLVVNEPVTDGGEPSAAVLIDVGDLAPELFATRRTHAEHGTSPTALPGADEAFLEATAQGGNQLVARIGTMVASTNDGSPIPAWRPAAIGADVSLRLDGAALGAVLAKQASAGPGEGPLEGAALGAASGRITYDLVVVPEGVHERLSSDAPAPWFRPVERAALDRLPVNALTSLALGIDGAQLWPFLRERMLTPLAKSRGVSLDESEVALDAELAKLGVTTGLEDLVTGLKGTITLAISPAAPFPGVTMSLPRSAGIDDLVATLAARIGGEVPTVGTASMLPLPGAPVMLNLACDERTWLITSDAAQATAWLGGKAGWSTSAAAVRALEQAGPDAVLIGASDTPALVRTLIPFVALGMARGADAKLKQSTLAALGRVAELAKTGWMVGRTRGDGVEFEVRGLFGYAMLPVVCAAAGLAVPNLLESRISANEAAAASSLKSGVFPAQILFQSASYADDDGNGIGDFGFLTEMSGGQLPGSDLKISLLPATWNASTPLLNGYRFATWVYAGPGAASADPRERAAAKAQAEMGFVVYAWPDDRKHGRRIFAITATGVVHSTMWDGNPPEWFALWGSAEQAWTGKPVWPVHKR